MMRRAERLRRAAEHGARQYGPTFARAAYEQALKEDPAAAADMTEEQLLGLMKARLIEVWKAEGTVESLMRKRGVAV